MRRILAFTSLLLAAGSAWAQAGSQAANSTVIYKHVDESGRVTYANVPIKGGVKVDLEPITIIPATPSGSLVAQPPIARMTPPPLERVTVKAPVEAVKDTPSSNFTIAPQQPPMQPVVATPVAVTDAPTTLALAGSSIDNATRLAEQRRNELRRRNLEADVQSEEQALAAARTALAEEQRGSGQFRAMRAAFMAGGDSGAQSAVATPEKRAEIERHFERVRNLQDQVAMHEAQLQGLRQQLATLK
ncbi:MAG TPA: hypothetical protein VFV17_06360 [Usitatibacteraceae bacterium]|nr:hypothetical protein [Usitatibacteraceae bacterium]